MYYVTILSLYFFIFYLAFTWKIVKLLIAKIWHWTQRLHPCFKTIDQKTVVQCQKLKDYKICDTKVISGEQLFNPKHTNTKYFTNWPRYAIKLNETYLYSLLSQRFFSFLTPPSFSNNCTFSLNNLKVWIFQTLIVRNLNQTF